MNISFYNSAISAFSYQEKLDVIANNMANLTTNAYKGKNATFSDLLHSNIRAGETTETTRKAGSGAKVGSIYTLHNEGGANPTGSPWDYRIDGDGFFAVQNPETDEIYYTRDGSFHRSEDGDKFYLATGSGEYVLDSKEQRIEIKAEDAILDVGIFDFPEKEGLINVGSNMFAIPEYYDDPELVKDKVAIRGQLEGSNVDLSLEMTRLIETQRAFQMNLKMLQTSDEITQNIQNLR